MASQGPVPPPSSSPNEVWGHQSLTPEVKESIGEGRAGRTHIYGEHSEVEIVLHFS